MRKVGLLAALALAATTVVTVAAHDRKFEAELSGDQERPTPRVTDASGEAVFKLEKDGDSLRYELEVEDIENVFMAHIHLAPPGQNGPIVVWLYPSTAAGVRAPVGGGPIDGRIARGVITEENLVGPLVNGTLDDLLAAIRAGNAYVNVHTDDGIAPADTGPGDFPGGEIRGQIELHGGKGQGHDRH